MANAAPATSALNKRAANRIIFRVILASCTINICAPNARREPRAACGSSVSTAWLGGISFTDYLPLVPTGKRRTTAFATSVTREISARLLRLEAEVARAPQFNQLGEVVPRLVAVAGLRCRLPRA